MTVPRIRLVRCDLLRRRLQSVRGLHRAVTRGAVDEQSRFCAGQVGNKHISRSRDDFELGLPLLDHRDISCSRAGCVARTSLIDIRVRRT